MPTIVGTPTQVLEGGASSNWSHSHLLPSGGGSSRRGIITVHHTSAASISSITYGGLTPTRVIGEDRGDNGADGSSSHNVIIYSLTESQLATLTDGNSFDLDISYSGASLGLTSFILLDDATQDAITDTASDGDTVDWGTGNKTLNIAVSSSDSFILDALQWDDEGDTGAPDAEQTEIYDAGEGGNQHLSSHKTASSNTTMGWTPDSTVADYAWVIAVIPSDAIKETGKTVTITGAVSETNTQDMVETAKALTAVAVVSETDFKVQFETGLSLTAIASITGSHTYVHIETGASITIVGVLTEDNVMTMDETGKSFTMVGVLNSYLGAFTPTPKGGAAGSFIEQTPNSSGGFTRA